MMKQIAAGVFEAKKPVEVCFGTVQSRSPFQVRLDQKKILGKEYFIVRYGVTVQDLLDRFKVGAGKQLDNDRILLSAQ